MFRTPLRRWKHKLKNQKISAQPLNSRASLTFTLALFLFEIPRLLQYRCPNRKILEHESYCANKNQHEHLRQLKSLSWYWDPMDCDLIYFDAESVLESIRGRKIVFMGDHLTEQWYHHFTFFLSLLEISRFSLRLGNPIFLTYSSFSSRDFPLF